MRLALAHRRIMLVLVEPFALRSDEELNPLSLGAGMGDYQLLHRSRKHAVWVGYSSACGFTCPYYLHTVPQGQFRPCMRYSMVIREPMLYRLGPWDKAPSSPRAPKGPCTCHLKKSSGPVCTILRPIEGVHLPNPGQGEGDRRHAPGTSRLTMQSR